MQKVVLATNNPNKLKEVREILKGTDIEVLSLADVGVEHEVVEDCDTFEGNARKKASEIMRLTGMTTIADDSGLCVDALDGEPGVYSARYAMNECAEGQDLDDANNDKLLREMQGQDNRKAHFTCAIAVCFDDGGDKILTADWHGEIAMRKAGDGGFGYDRVFYLPEYGCTSAQLDAGVKNQISHRAKALQQLICVFN